MRIRNIYPRQVILYHIRIILSNNKYDKIMEERKCYLMQCTYESPEDETIEETLDRHKRTLFEFAKKAGLTVSEIYCEVVSGDGLFVRPEMIRLLNDVEQGLYGGVICMDIDRLGRVDTKDRGIILNTFKESGTKIITPTKTYDLSDEIDEFSTEMQMLFARQELKKITKRLRAGITRSVTDGCHVGEPPYGYRRTYIDKKPTLEIYEPEAEVIRMVYDMYVNQHFGSSTIARTLNNMGLKPRKNDHFSRTTISFYLSNPIYIGKIVFNKRHIVKKKLPTDKHVRVLNPQEDWIVTDGIHPAIIDEKLFEEAQTIRLTRAHPPSFTGELMNPLAGLVRCANCGEIMTRQTSKKTPPRLICNTVACNRSTLVELVEEEVLEMLSSTLTNCNISNEAKKENENRIATVKSTITEFKKQLTVLNGQKDNLHDLLEQGVYDIKTFTERSKLITDKISSVEQTLEKNNKILISIDKEPQRKEIVPLVECLLENHDTMSAADKNVILKKAIRNIYYRREKKTNSKFEIKIEFTNWL